MRIKCPICEQLSTVEDWKVEYSSVLEWAVIVCPECGDGLCLNSIIKEMEEDETDPNSHLGARETNKIASPFILRGDTYCCGCCGISIDFNSLWCFRCDEHVTNDTRPPWERTYLAQHKKPCPYQISPVYLGEPQE